MKLIVAFLQGCGNQVFDYSKVINLTSTEHLAEEEKDVPQV